MLFNSFIFIFAFLPLTLAVFYLASRWSKWSGRFSLTALSLGFYAWWQPKHLPLLLFAIVFNYVVGDIIQRRYREGRPVAVRNWLAFGLIVDVALLAYFKYAMFFVDNMNLLFGSQWHIGRIALPLAISFFTFQKIAYLVDSARGEAKEMKLLDFFLFASFFPQLIAGPITHYGEIVPQFKKRLFGKLLWHNLMIGLVIFAIGLAKKTVIADTMAGYADPFYAAVNGGRSVGLVEGWFGALAFTVQIYFDFSGYSDMAIGLARMFGIKLPLNFHSPLRASSILDYWRRWHMTLQRFIVLYIYRPIAMPLARFSARRGLRDWSAFALEVGVPTLLTFFISGVWHGAGWTFVVWGLLHAVYLCCNEIWRERTKRRRRKARKARVAFKEPGILTIAGYHVLTLVAVFFANVVFRATDVDDAWRIWAGMVGVNGMGSLQSIPAYETTALVAMAIGFLVIFLLPNTQQIMARFDPALNWNEWKDVGRPVIPWRWSPRTIGLVFAGVTLFLGIVFIQRGQAIFLYFNF